MFNFRYILFVGTTVKFDEIFVLNKLNNILSDNNINAKIVYRPHPWRENEDFSDITNLKNVVLDPQLSEQYLSKSRSNTYQPSLDSYADLVGGSEFVIGGMTSMLMEAQLLKKHFVGLVHKEPGNPLGPREMLSGYTHFSEIFLLIFVSYPIK